MDGRPDRWPETPPGPQPGTAGQRDADSDLQPVDTTTPPATSSTASSTPLPGAAPSPAPSVSRPSVLPPARPSLRQRPLSSWQRVQLAARALLWLPALVWALGTPFAAFVALTSSMTFFGANLSPEQAHRTSLALGWAAGCAVGAPLVGLVLAWVAGSERSRGWYMVMAVLGALACVGFFTLQPRDPAAPPQRPERVVCQEHSGGDTTCPGG